MDQNQIETVLQQGGTVVRVVAKSKEEALKALTELSIRINANDAKWIDDNWFCTL